MSSTAPENPTHALWRHAQAGDTSQVRELAFKLVSSEQSLDVQDPDDVGRTALHKAVAGGYLHCVQVLLRAGANALLPDDEGHLPRDIVDLSKGGGCQRELKFAEQGECELRVRRQGRFVTERMPRAEARTHWITQQSQPRKRRERGSRPRRSGGRGRREDDPRYSNRIARREIPVASSNANEPALTARVASYNVLAKAYTRPHYFPWSKPEDLAWDTRVVKIAADLHASGADIACLQEVDQYESLCAALESQSSHWTGVHLGRNGKPDGCTTFYNAEVFALENRVDVLFDNHAEERRDKVHSVALVLHLRHRTTDKHVLVANTHLYYKGGAKNGQIQVLTRQLDEFAAAHADIDFATVLCGDLNAKPGHFVHSHLADAGLSSVFPLTEDTHSLGFTAFTGNSSMLDYIYVSLSKISVASGLSLPDADLALPNQQFGSDHMLIAATLHFN